MSTIKTKSFQKYLETRFSKQELAEIEAEAASEVRQLRSMQKIKKNKNITSSSGNVFADLGLSNPEERLAKAELARQINNIIKERKLTQTAAAALLDIDQPKISALSTGKLAGFSIDRLFRFLNSLDQNITIRVTPRARSKKHAEIIVAVPPVRS